MITHVENGNKTAIIALLLLFHFKNKPPSLYNISTLEKKTVTQTLPPHSPPTPQPGTTLSPSFFLSVHLCLFFLLVHSFYMSVYPSIHLSICLYLSTVFCLPPLSLSICQYLYLPISLFLYLSIYLSIFKYKYTS